MCSLFHKAFEVTETMESMPRMLIYIPLYSGPKNADCASQIVGNRKYGQLYSVIYF